MNIAQRLKQARKSKGYTQDALASAIGVSRGVISNIEYEKTEPQALVIHAICDALQIDERWLISGKGRMESPNLERSARLLSEIYNSARELSGEEQDYILDMIKTFQKHRENIVEGKEGAPESNEE